MSKISTDNRKVGGIKEDKISEFSNKCILFPAGVSAFFLLLFIFYPQLNSCNPHSVLNYIWPQNFLFASQLTSRGLALSDVCMFLNMNILMSVFFLSWVIWRIFYEFLKGRKALKPGLLAFMGIAFLVVLLLSLIPFSEQSTFFSMSYNKNMIFNVIINAANVLLIYWCAGELIASAFVFIRLSLRGN